MTTSTYLQLQINEKYIYKCSHVKKAGGNVSFLSNAMVTRSDEARSLDAEIRRQTSFKALKRNESCQNKEIIKKKESVSVIIFVKAVLMGFFKNS